MHAGRYASRGARVIAGGLEVPDLRPHFKHLHWRPMPHSMGVPVASDFADRPASDPVFGLYKNCGLWTQDEAAILYNIAAAVRGRWLDLGCHTGWTSAHQAAAGCEVTAVDNMLPVFPFHERFQENVEAWDIEAFAGTTQEFFEWVSPDARFSGVVIDADHEHPWPLKDAQKAVEHLEERGVILFHDFIGRPVRTAVEYLMSRGFNCRVYWTAHMVACCWRGEFVPPQHRPLPGIDWQRVKESMRDFVFDRCV
jgi:SAM-dependent methyltransferase